MRYQITHRTEYLYETEVSTSNSEARLLPRDDERQSCVFSELLFDPTPADSHHYVDFFGNRVCHFQVDRPHTRLRVTAVSEVEVRRDRPRIDVYGDEPWEEAIGHLRHEHTREAVEARAYTLESPLVSLSQELRAYAEPSFPSGRPLVEAALDLTSRIHAEFDYQPGTTTTTTPVKEVLGHRSGVCQDFAHLGIGCLRAMGLPARYVSGYLETEPPPGADKLLGADASHAWVSVFVPGSGWLDLDPTNDQVPDGRYVVTAWGRDYGDVTPIKGVVFSGGGHHDLAVAVDVVRVVAP
jgi:transglutaminase-like putative cysteine protease